MEGICLPADHTVQQTIEQRVVMIARNPDTRHNDAPAMERGITPSMKHRFQTDQHLDEEKKYEFDMQNLLAVQKSR
jgi:hypothetical protein